MVAMCATVAREAQIILGKGYIKHAFMIHGMSEGKIIVSFIVHHCPVSSFRKIVMQYIEAGKL